jgi:preprotein translocase SecE subunit
VPRQTRQQRRARRQEQDQATLQRTRARQQPVPAAQPTPAHAGVRRAPGAGRRRFISESWAELKKVEWPRQPQLIQGTAVVLIACLIVGVYLFAADQIFRRLVEHVFLGQ